MKQLNILIACEYSGAVREAFRKLGHNAISCDLLESEDNSPFHYQGNVFDIIKGNPFNNHQPWDLMIAHPPCTDLAVSGSRWFPEKIADGRQDIALQFVRDLMDAPIEHILIENPISVISSKIRKPNQIIQPWQFGDPFQKSTCLWLKNLPLLAHTKIVDKGEFKEWIDKKTGKVKRQATWYYEAFKKGKEDRWKDRSRTFQGIADAIADQYSNYILNKL
jgi:site-specific DNA-cytosine methylase